MRTPVVYPPPCGNSDTSGNWSLMTAEDMRLLAAHATKTKAVSKASNNEIKQLPDGLYVKTPSWTNKEW